MGALKGFLDFIKEYGVVGMAIGVVIGVKVNDLVKSVVEQLIMPFVGLLIPSGDWKQIAFEVGNAKFGVGIVLGSFLDFTIVAFVVYAFAKFILREQKVTKK
jgi:large conductance mechanosensitive channel